MIVRKDGAFERTTETAIQHQTVISLHRRWDMAECYQKVAHSNGSVQKVAHSARFEPLEVVPQDLPFYHRYLGTHDQASERVRIGRSDLV
jgi:hypothetical protein